MNEQKKLRIYTILRIMSLVFILIMGFLFTFETLKIYISKGEQIFTSEKISKAIIEILPIIIIGIILIIATGVFSFFIIFEKKQRMKITNEQKYNTLKQNLDIKNEQSLLKEHKIRLITNIISISLIFICLVIISFYLFNPKHFNDVDDVNKQVIKGVIYFSPWLLIMLIIGFIRMFILEASYLRSNKIILDHKYPFAKKEKKNMNKYLLISVQLTLISVAIFLIVFGAVNQGAIDVLKKAINICSECIGLG